MHNSMLCIYDKYQYLLQTHRIIVSEKFLQHLNLSI
jgi:hypothetical protein